MNSRFQRDTNRFEFNISAKLCSILIKNFNESSFNLNLNIVNSGTPIPRSSEWYRARRVDLGQVGPICSCSTQRRSRAFSSNNSVRELLGALHGLLKGCSGAKIQSLLLTFGKCARSLESVPNTSFIYTHQRSAHHPREKIV